MNYYSVNSLAVPPLKVIAYFVTSHGYGHATRSIAVINEVNAITDEVHFLIVCDLPEWFWSQGLDSSVNYSIFNTKTDIGLCQIDPFNFDLQKSLKEVREFINKPVQDFHELFTTLAHQKPSLIVCDISPLGLKLANALGVKSTLIENFTWDWIYADYVKECTEFNEISKGLQDIYQMAGLRIQATPFCEFHKDAIQVNPIHRKFKSSKKMIKDRLKIPENQQMILISTGGNPDPSPFEKKLNDSPLHFLLCGKYDRVCRTNNITKIPIKSCFNFPDLIHSSNSVIGKVGYGMTVECWAGDTEFFGIYRKDFRESKVLRKFCFEESIGEEITLDEFNQCQWLPNICDKIEDYSDNLPQKESGNLTAARAILKEANL